MPFTNFPNGLTSLGIPLVGSGGPTLSIPNKNGTVWFVDASNGSDGNDGLSPQTPFSTIGKAVSKAGNGTGDTIYVTPGTYSENVVVAVDYLSIVGSMQAGYARPDVTPATGVPLTVNAQGFQCFHMRFAGTAADTVVQKGNGFYYADNTFDGDGTAAKGVRLVPHATNTHLTASEGRMQNNLFRGFAMGLIFDSGAVTGSGTGSTDNVIQENLFYSNTVDITAAKTGAGALYSLKTTNFIRNYFADKNKALYVDLTTNCDGAAGNQTGTFMDNYLNSSIITGNTTVKTTGTGFNWIGTLYMVGIKDGTTLV